MRQETTSHFADLGDCIVIIKGVPCSKCTQCGEVSYSGIVALRLEQIISNLKESHTEVAVITYSAA